MTSQERSVAENATSTTESAACWALEAQQGITDKRRAQRDAWLSERPAHAEAYRIACAALAALDRHAAQPEIMALRQAALAARPERATPSFLLTRGIVVAVLMAGVGWWSLRRDDRASSSPAMSAAPATVVVSSHIDPLRYSTAVGERSTIDLSDGSVMVLNTASSAEVVYTHTERTVRLLQGQALFTVAHGQPAPFRVYAGDRVITAVGTVFDVRLEGERVQVAMIEGTVRVDAPPSRPSVTETGETLSAGETLTAGPQEPVRVKVANVERLASWRSGLLTFEDTRLADAIAEINRYTMHPLTLADASTGNYRVSGTFRVGDSERFARTMTELFPLDLQRSTDGNDVLKNRVAVTNK